MVDTTSAFRLAGISTGLTEPSCRETGCTLVGSVPERFLEGPRQLRQARLSRQVREMGHLGKERQRFTAPPKLVNSDGCSVSRARLSQSSTNATCGRPWKTR